mgnify:CR=1 FL=1
MVDPYFFWLVEAGIIEWPPRDEEWERIKKKAPWELTRDEWWRRTRIIRDESGEAVMELPNGDVVRTGLKDLGFSIEEFLENMKRLKRMAYKVREEVVRNALKNGKYVPREVVREVLGE